MPRSIFDRLAGVPETGLLSEEDRGMMRQRGLLTLGTSLLRQAQPTTDVPVGLGAGIGTALQEAQQAGLQGLQLQDLLKQRVLQQRRQEVMSKYAGATDPTSMQSMFQELIALGDYEGARSVAEVLKSLAGGAGGFRVVTGLDEQGTPTMYRVGPTGERTALGPAEPKAPRAPSLQRVPTPGGGAEFALYEPPSAEHPQGRFVPTGQAAFTVPTEIERKAAFFSNFMNAPETEQAFAAFDEAAPGRIESFMQAHGLRELTNPEMQALDYAGSMAAEGWLRMTTGAAYNDTEFENSFRLFVPQPGDKPATLALKRRARARLRSALNSVAGRAAINSGVARHQPGSGMTVTDVLGEDIAGGLAAAGYGATLGVSDTNPLDKYLPPEGGQ
jgi:hypothetical protein